jgi:hypothetical protein
MTHTTLRARYLGVQISCVTTRIIFGIKEYKDEHTLGIVKEELKNKSQIETTDFIEAKR